jgi:hypothetical protein
VNGCCLHIESFASLAAQAGISVRNVYKWLARYRSGGNTALVDGRSGQEITCQRVLSDNGSTYRSKPWREACSALGLTPRNAPGRKRHKPTARLSDMAFQTSTERNCWLPCYLAIYNGLRCYMALAGRTPIQQLGLLRTTE